MLFCEDDDGYYYCVKKYYNMHPIFALFSFSSDDYSNKRSNNV